MSVVGLNGFDCEMASGAVPGSGSKSSEGRDYKERRYRGGHINRKAKGCSISNRISYKS